MKIRTDSYVVLCLCTSIGLPKNTQIRPLTSFQWWTTVNRLNLPKHRWPELLQSTENLSRYGIKRETVDIIKRLGKNRVLEDDLFQWRDEDGIMVITCADPLYPESLFKFLGNHAPPVLYVKGNLELLSSTYRKLSVTGTRDAADDALHFASELANQCVVRNIALVSGGAHGIDITAHQAVLDAGGATIFVLPYGLANGCQALQKIFDCSGAGKYLLVSLFHPYDPFHSYYAIARNAVIYALGEMTVVVSAHYNKGGSWSGAVKWLKKYPQNVCVRESVDEGNRALIWRGAYPVRTGSASLIWDRYER